MVLASLSKFNIPIMVSTTTICYFCRVIMTISIFMNSPITETVFSDCPIRQVLSHVCSKWSLLVIYTLNQHTRMRFNTIAKSIPDISQKMLTSTLRALEADGLIERAVYAEVPPRVEYALTPRAQSFIPLIEDMIQWALNNMAGILRDRCQKNNN